MARSSFMLGGMVLAAALFLPVAGRAEEEGAPGAKPRAADAERPGGEDRARVREIVQKQRAGEELTADEKAFLEKARNRLGQALAPGADREKARPALVEGLELVNALDAVKLSLAQAYAGRNQLDKAIEVLEEIVKSSQDPTAVGFAHLALARIYKQKGDADKSAAELKKVGGAAAAGALAMMLESAGAKGSGEQAGKLEEILKSAEDPVLKALVLRRLSALYAQAGSVEKLAALKERCGEILSYKEAQAAFEIEQKAARQSAPRPAGAMPGGGPPGLRGGGGAGPEGQGELGPRKGGAGGENLEAMRAKLKELEAAGMVEEAAALKKQIKFMEERRGEKQKGKADGKPMPPPEPNTF